LEAVVQELPSQGGCERDAPVARATLRSDEACLPVPVSPNVDQVGVEVDVVPLQRLQLAQPQHGVEGGGEDRPVVGLEGVEERADLCWRRTRSLWLRTTGSV